MLYLSLPPFWASWLVAPWPSSARLPSPSSLFSRSRPVQPLRAPRPAELRMDVHHAPHDIDRELDALHARLHTPGDTLYGIHRFRLLDDPDLVAHHREADGEEYIYIEDVRRQRLAGYFIFNRLIELNRVADRHLRAPHTKIAQPYQRRGIATATYRWALQRGQCLLSGARQSCGAHALWERLAREHTCGYVSLQNKSVVYLGDAVSQQTLDELNTRRLMLGRGWSIDRLARAARMQISADDACGTVALR